METTVLLAALAIVSACGGSNGGSGIVIVRYLLDV